MATDIELVEQAQADYTHIDEMAGASPVINLVNGLIQRAVRDGASDIHIESGRNRSFVRFRIDGVLYEVLSTRADLHPAIVSRLKVMANLDIAERRLPQDGRMQVTTQGRSVDLRFSSLAGIYGEKVVLRVLDKNNSILDVEKLGMSATNLASLKKLLNRSHGLILVTGPTGSGKTTTLYTLLSLQNTTETAIVTIEDPIEYAIAGVNQIQVNSRTGLTFAHGLRSILRQDPNTIMVGEIRDIETAGLAINIALTGHIVVSTLHTNDAATTLPRLLDMKIEPYLIASTVNIAIGQRLIRRLCEFCKQDKVLSTNEVDEMSKLLQNIMLYPGIKVKTAKGCSLCNQSGYAGRIGIHEVLLVTPAIRTAIIARASAEQLRTVAMAEGMIPLIEDGFLKVLSGITTIEEVLKINYE